MKDIQMTVRADGKNVPLQDLGDISFDAADGTEDHALTPEFKANLKVIWRYRDTGVVEDVISIARRYDEEAERLVRAGNKSAAYWMQSQRDREVHKFLDARNFRKIEQIQILREVNNRLYRQIPL